MPIRKEVLLCHHLVGLGSSRMPKCPSSKCHQAHLFKVLCNQVDKIASVDPGCSDFEFGRWKLVPSLPIPKSKFNW